MTYLAFKTTPRGLYLLAFMALSFPPTLNRVDQYKQWDTVEMRLVLSNCAASSLFSGISCWESHCHIMRILKQSYGEVPVVQNYVSLAKSQLGLEASC